jgi:hypothetical protein
LFVSGGLVFYLVPKKNDSKISKPSPIIVDPKHVEEPSISYDYQQIKADYKLGNYQKVVDAVSKYVMLQSTPDIFKVSAYSLCESSNQHINVNDHVCKSEADKIINAAANEYKSYLEGIYAGATE